MQTLDLVLCIYIYVFSGYKYALVIAQTKNRDMSLIMRKVIHIHNFCQIRDTKRRTVQKVIIIVFLVFTVSSLFCANATENTATVSKT